ncbi:Asp-tRNA(Asn)/Glu-tRNA(Gln) amidotransferase A subunit family amidase [Neorhizobium galegae]|uniref:amidase family protein n=1 Tax=Neorhizobium galegae TaxID=399 RepID=UPI001AEA9D17|nr:amidase family protein [Neorhizobium galegae]MBP2562492.1 Asp-tRNA(Asn)/Glu-tRNA(Gln) amidotransferase A subunit family amidase [Neorhizobium galegae]
MQTLQPLTTTGFHQRIRAQLELMNELADDAKLAVLQRRDDAALSEAEAWETLASSGSAPRLPISLSVKACFDVQGWVTTAASRVLEAEKAAEADSGLVMKLRQNGAVVVNQANMTEFAFGALGINTNFGTPRSPLDPKRERIAGGSTSGGAVSVALGFADVALGSDTSGSIRIPAAFCGLAGFKPSHHRYDRSGMLFLAPSFDVPGFIARDVTTLQRVDEIITGETYFTEALPLEGMRFLVPKDIFQEGADQEVATAFADALLSLKQAGAVLVELDFPELRTYGQIAVHGGIIIAEGYAWHAPLLERSAHLYDRRVGPRIALGADVRASDYLSALQKLSELSEHYHHRLANFDGLLTPTIPILPPRFQEAETDEAYPRFNRLSFQLTEIANRVDAPSVTIAPDPTKAIGLMVTGRKGEDRRLLKVSRALEATFRGSGEDME